MKRLFKPATPYASLLALAAVALVSPGMAEDGGTPADEPASALQPPAPPPPVESGEPLQPDVRIRETGRETVYEYKRNGRVYLVRVVPRVGPPYHFYDINGDGVLEYRPGEPMHHQIHQWTLFRW